MTALHYLLPPFHLFCLQLPQAVLADVRQAQLLDDLFPLGKGVLALILLTFQVGVIFLGQILVV